MMIVWMWKVRKTEESGRTSKFLIWATGLEAIVEVRASRRRKGPEGQM